MAPERPPGWVEGKTKQEVLVKSEFSGSSTGSGPT